MSNIIRFGLVGLILWAASLVAAFAQCPSGEWVTLAPMEEPRQELAASALDGKIYAIGGLSGRDNANSIYDPEKDSWSTGADFPIGTDHAWAVTLNGNVYAGGGRTNRVFAYDPKEDAWSEVASTAYTHGGTPAAVVIDGLIYVAGGTGGTQTELEVYNPKTNSWTELSPMNCARNHTAGGVVNGKLYVAGGRPGNQDCLEEYDPETDTWTIKSPMPTGRSGIAGAAFGNCLYIFGGEGNGDDPNGIFHQVEAYNAVTDQWTPLDPMQTGRHGIYAATIEYDGATWIFLPGGATQAGFGVTDVNDAYVVSK